jgi:hypothetical protein
MTFGWWLYGFFLSVLAGLLIAVLYRLLGDVLP